MAEQGYYGTENNPYSHLFGERIVFTLHTSDPSGVQQGDMWVRTDLNSGDKVATMRWFNANGIQDVPLFAESETTGSDVVKVLPIQTTVGELFMPLQNGGGVYSEVGFQHSGARHGVHNSLTALPDSGLYRYEFEQDVTDSWGSNDATDNTSAGYVTGQVGSFAKDFDGSNDYLALPDNSNFDIGSSAGYTIGAWFKSSTAADQRIFNFSGGNGTVYLILSDEDSDSGYELTTFVRDDNGNGPVIDSGTAVDDGAWHHGVSVIDTANDDLYLYLNGSEVASDTSAGWNTSISSDTQRIGRSTSDTQPFDGPIDDARGYSKALTATEVSNWHSTGSING